MSNYVRHVTIIFFLIDINILKDVDSVGGWDTFRLVIQFFVRHVGSTIDAKIHIRRLLGGSYRMLGKE